MQVRKTILWILIVLTVLGLIVRFGYQPITKALGLGPKSGIRVESNVPAKVYLNGKEVGVTPFQNESLTSGEYNVELQAQPDNQTASSSATTSNITWKRQVKLNPGTLTVVHRELENGDFSSGEVITLEKGKGVSIISTPSESEVNVDGQDRGVSPITLSNLQPGEHQFIISKGNYLKRSVRATSIDNFTLVINVDLAPTGSGTPTTTPQPASSASPQASASPTPSSSAKATSQVVIKNTPNGFLRVRKAATTSSDEVARVNEGDTLTVLDDQGSWLKVQLSNGTVGFVSSAYTQKK